jgi:hypothetical protein
MRSNYVKESEAQAVRDEEHLKLLRIGYLVAGGADALFALFPLIYVGIGLILAISGAGSSGRAGEPSPAVFGLLFVIIGLVASFIFAVQGALKLAAARAIGQRQSRTMCLIAAALSCVQLPWGTFLGVMTFMVLSRPSVKDRFDATASPGQLSAPPERAAASLFDEEDARVR